jgi:hypothetical protein
MNDDDDEDNDDDDEARIMTLEVDWRHGGRRVTFMWQAVNSQPGRLVA